MDNHIYLYIFILIYKYIFYFSHILLSQEITFFKKLFIMKIAGIRAINYTLEVFVERPQ